MSALFTRKDGIVDFDDRRCIGCKACTQACPYDAIYMHPDDHTSAKCNYCTHRVDIGLEPACVNVCPEHAIISGDMDNPSSEISQLLARETVSVRKPEKGTNPKLFYIDGDKASLDPSEAHPDSDYMWSSQRYGVGHYAKFAEAKVAGKQISQPVQIEPREKKPRRVYDAPGKGVLWGWEVSTYVWTKAIASGAYLFPFFIFKVFANQIPILFNMVGAGISLLFLALTGVLLIKDLGRPERFIYTLLRPQWRSWLTRGSYIITLFSGILALWWAAFFLKQFQYLWIIEWLGVMPAFLTAVYTAFLFAQAKGRDFWQSPMLAIHMVLHSLIAGGAALLISDIYFDWHSSWMGGLKTFTGFFLILNLITTAIELTTTHSTHDAATVAHEITRGQFSRQFWLGTILIGNVLPLMLFIFAPAAAAVPAAILILAGLYIGEHIWVKAPQMIPLS